MKIIKLFVIALLAAQLSGCFLTKLVSTPIRLVGSVADVGGAVVSILPAVGNSADETLEMTSETLDKVADGIDDIPL